MGFALEVASRVKRIFSSRTAKEKASNGANPFADSGFGDKIASSGRRGGVSDFGSKDETFFDTRVWLDSDCEDDFYSVNGEFTPSRGSTPNHHLGTRRTNGRADYDDTFPETKSETSPTDKKKKLAELLQVSLGEQAGVYEVDQDEAQSLCEGTLKPKKERTGMASACCMPGLVPGIASRKQKMSPAR